MRFSLGTNWRLEPLLGFVVFLILMGFVSGIAVATRSRTPQGSQEVTNAVPPRISFESVSSGRDAVIGASIATDSQTGAQWLVIFDRHKGNISLAPLVKP